MGYIKEIRKKVGHDPVFMPFSCGAFFEDGKILLQKREDDGTWALNGGCLEFGETFDEALKREIKEELNVDVLEYEFICYEAGKENHHVYPNKDEVYPVGIVFLITKYSGVISPDNDEVLDLKWFPLDKLPENLFNADRHVIPKVVDYCKKKEVL